MASTSHFCYRKSTNGHLYIIPAWYRLKGYIISRSIMPNNPNRCRVKLKVLPTNIIRGEFINRIYCVGRVCEPGRKMKNLYIDNYLPMLALLMRCSGAFCFQDLSILL